ncbi:mandelate racemase [Alphaproteobacteria bacterium]|nr:mandelate racemase [Alphaproteobacteria bacterium]
MTEVILKKVKIRGVNIPLNKPIIAHLGTFTSWPYLCVDLITNDNDVIGRSYIGPYLKEYLPAIASSARVLIKNYKGKKLEPYSFYQNSMKSLSLLGFKGVALYALAALDIAIWDAFAKIHKKPFVELLGGTIKNKIKAYNSRGLWLIDINQIAKESETLRKEGDFTALKLRIGRETYKQDIKAYKEVIKGAGSDITMMSDYNQCFTVKEALRRCHELDDIGFFWFEEPIQYNMLRDMEKLCREIKTPITIGENFHGPKDAHDALLSNSCDMIMPDLMRIGGVSGWLKTATMAESFNAEVSSHLFPEVSAHLMCLTPTAEWLEWTDWANPILKEPYKIDNGNIIIPDKPGFGLDWNEKAISEYEIDL